MLFRSGVAVLDAADLDGDGLPEVLVGTWEGEGSHHAAEIRRIHRIPSFALFINRFPAARATEPHFHSGGRVPAPGRDGARGRGLGPGGTRSGSRRAGREVPVGAGPGSKGLPEGPNGRDHLAPQGIHGGHVKGSGEDVVRRLSEVDVVVGMNGTLLSPPPSQDLAGTVGEHLVDVHVGLGAGPGLPDHEGELLRVAPPEDLVRGGND